jgi:SAM-dependent methyltransferase
MNAPFGSADYWDARYRAGGNSGAGSYGRLAAYKAAVINGLIKANGVGHVADFGCGDGNLLSLLRLEAYTGLDVSAAALERCARRFPQYGFLPFARATELRPAELTLSVDVIYHLVEDAVFADHMSALFAASTRLVLLYASNADLDWPAPHVRHRCFTRHVAARIPGWGLRAHLPNPYPFDPAMPDQTSFADFFVYAKDGADCLIASPSTIPRT